MESDLIDQVDRVHAALGRGVAPPEALSGYLAFLDGLPQETSISPNAIVAVAMIDNVLAWDELKLEQRKLREALDAIENTTYELLVRIGQKHAEIISRSNA
jgi:hypothetical protein